MTPDLKVTFDGSLAVLSVHAVKFGKWRQGAKVASRGWGKEDLERSMLFDAVLHFKRGTQTVSGWGNDSEGNRQSFKKRVAGKHFFVQVREGDRFLPAKKVLASIVWPSPKRATQKPRPFRFSVRVERELKIEVDLLKQRSSISESHAAADLAVESICREHGLALVDWGISSVPGDRFEEIGLFELDSILGNLKSLQRRPFGDRFTCLLDANTMLIDGAVLEVTQRFGLFLASVSYEAASSARKWFADKPEATAGCRQVVNAALGECTHVWSQIRRKPRSASARQDNVVSLELSEGLLKKVHRKCAELHTPSRWNRMSESDKRVCVRDVVRVLFKRLTTIRLMCPVVCERFPFVHPASKVLYGALDRKLEKIGVALRKLSSKIAKVEPGSDSPAKRLAALALVDDCVEVLEFRRKQLRSVPALVELGLADVPSVRWLAIKARWDSENGNKDAAAAADLLDYLTCFDSADVLSELQEESDDR